MSKRTKIKKTGFFPTSKTISLILIGLFAGLSVAFYIMNQRAQISIESYASNLFAVPVQIQDINVSYVSHTVKIQGLDIENPPGFPKGNFAYVDEIRLSSPDLSARPLTIHKIEVRGVKLNISKSGENTDTNMDAVLDRLFDDRPISEFQLSLIPNTINFKNIAIYPNASQYPELEASYKLDNYMAIFNDAGMVKTTVRELVQDVFDTLSRDTYQAMLAARIQSGVNEVIDSGFKALDAFSKSLEGE